MLKLLILLGIAIISYSLFPDTKKDPNCDKWANEGRCISDSSYMWSACHTSCMLNAYDKDSQCHKWAEAGECTRDPGYIQLHCPEACGKAIGWSPWTRTASGITKQLPYFEEFTTNLNSCMKPADFVGAAEMISTQVIVFLNGGARMASGLATIAPTEYLGMFGLTEAILYALVLYSFNARFAIERLSKVNDAGIDEILELADARNARLTQKFQEISHIISLDFSADTLMRNLPIWQNVLHLASGDANLILQDYNKYFPAEYPLFNACPKPRGPPLTDITKLLPQLRSPETQNPVTTHVILANEVMMPVLGLGTWQLPMEECESTVLEAIRLGYRHIDTGEAYGNEVSVGWAIFNAIEEGLVEREELFIATKLSDEQNAGYMEVKKLVVKQLERLKVNYIDLYYLHSPMEKQMETWKALEELVDEGVIRSLGVSNFEEQDLNSLFSYIRIKPVVLQNKVDVYHIGKQIDDQGDGILALARTNSMQIVAYSPFSGFPFVLKPIQDPVVKYIAASRGNSPAQVILRWQLQHGMASVPRASDSNHLKENLAVLTMPPLSIQEMHMLDVIQFLAESPITKAVPQHTTHSDL